MTTPGDGDDTATAFWTVGERRGELRRGPLPAPGPGEVLVRSRFSAISRGSEALVFTGRVPAAQAEAIRAPFQGGAFPWPVKYGYASVGAVEAGPPELLGREVFCLHPHQDRYVVPAEAVTPLPEGLPAGRAVLAANMETAVTALWDGAPGLGDCIAVIGAGTVGCLTAALAAGIPGCAVTLVDRDPAKRAPAEALGLAFARPDEAAEASGGRLDLLFHASGSPDGLALALELAGVEARVVELSWYGDLPVPVPLGAEFHVKRLTLRGSQVSRLPPERAPRWSLRRRLELALALLRDDPRLDLLITGESPFDQLPEVMARLAEAPPGVICHRVSYTG